MSTNRVRAKHKREPHQNVLHGVSLTDENRIHSILWTIIYFYDNVTLTTIKKIGSMTRNNICPLSVVSS